MKKQLGYGLVLSVALLAAQMGVAGTGYVNTGMTRVEQEVRRELITLPFYSVFDHFTFSVSGDTVTLMGHVQQPSMKAAAEKAVKGIEGVEIVKNEIEVLPPSPNDDTLRLGLYRAIYGNSTLQPLSIRALPPIHIIVKNGHVTLEGFVPNEMQKNIANLQAKGVSGVFSVTNNLRLDSEVSWPSAGKKEKVAKGPAELNERPAFLPTVSTSGDESKEITNLLAEAKSHAVELKQDALEMESFTRSTLSWGTHAAKITEIRNHVNAMGELASKLNSLKPAASVWQAQAIERIVPVLRELARNVEATIAHLSEEQGRHLQTPEHKEYLGTNAELATKLTELISNYVDYGNTKADLQRLTQKLEVSDRQL
jgi:hyperosmotically inducible protein